jgi:type IV secretion system protein VirD4
VKTDTQPGGAVDVVAVGSAAAVSLGAMLWGAGAASAWLAGHPIPHAKPLAGYAALADVSDPGRAWSAPMGPAVLYWTTTFLALLVVGVACWGGWKLWHYEPSAKGGGRGTPDGMATRSQVQRAAGAKALLRRSATLRGSLRRPRPADVGYRLGSSMGVDCWASVEDSMLLLGPPRSGKGLHEVIPMILDAPGAVVTTSTRPDNLAVTLRARAERGPVMIFAPQGIAGPPPQDLPLLRWPLTRGCEAAQTAMTRAEVLVADAAHSGVENANFWRAQAVLAAQSLLHAAALDGRPAADLFRWSHSAGASKEAVTILSCHPGASPGWDHALDAIIATDPRTRDSVWGMVANAFAPLADPAVLAAVTPEPGCEFDPLAFLAMRGTIYLLGTAEGGARATATLVAALIEDLIDAARRLAARSPRQRLDPPLALILDEAANYPLRCLPSLMSEGGGSGITTLAVLQSLAQARDRWGREAARAMWDAAIVKIVLGGSSDADDLSDLSRLVGERAVTEWSETRHATRMDRSVSSSVRYRPVLEPAQLRVMDFGTGLLLLRSAPPIMMGLTPWTDRPDAETLTLDGDAWEQQAIGA